MFGKVFYKSITEIELVSKKNFKKVGRSVDVAAVKAAYPDFLFFEWIVAMHHKDKNGKSAYRCLSTLPDGKQLQQDFYEKQI